MQKNIAKSWRIIWLSRQENYNLGEDLFSSKTATPSMQQKLHRNCSKTTRWMFWSGQVKAQISIQSRICGWTWKELFTPDPQATWQSWICFARKNGEKLQCPDVPAWLRHIHTDSVRWLQPKVHLPNTELKGVNIYAIIYFTLYIFN